MSLSENLDETFALLLHPSVNVALKAVEILRHFPDELLLDFFRQDDHSKAQKFYDFFAKCPMVTAELLDIFVIISSTEAAAEMAASDERIIQKLYSLAKNGENLKFILPLTQVTRMAPKTSHETLVKRVGNYFPLLTETFDACKGGVDKKTTERLVHIGYAFLNVTQFCAASEFLFKENIPLLSSFITNPKSAPGFKLVAAKILLNVSYHIDMHPHILTDQVIAEIVDPFADEEDEISTEEMDKLPLQLQYVDHKRSAFTKLLDSLIEILAQLTHHIHHQLKELLRHHAPAEAAKEIQQTIDDLIGTTAVAVDAGSSLITQIRVLGSLADSEERPAEVVESCLLIENVMLTMSTEWEMIETLWSEEQSKLPEALQLTATTAIAASPPKPQFHTKLGTQLNAIESWLHSARRRLQKDPNAVEQLRHESQTQGDAVQRLTAEISATAPKSALETKVTQIAAAVRQFIEELESGNAVANRLKEFLQSADALLNQLDQMSDELRDATPAVAGELGPLARQKARAVIDDGERLLLQHRDDRDATNIVAAKLDELRQKLNSIDALAKQRRDGNQHLAAQQQQLATWVRDAAEPFLANNGNLGSDSASAQQFLQTHWTFATDLINKESAVASVLGRAFEMSEEGKKQAQDFLLRYDRVKQTLERRIQLGNNFKQAYKFGVDVDKSLNEIAVLLDKNERSFADETVAREINNLFHVVQGTLAQERHQAEKFLSIAKVAAENDLHLNADHASDALSSALTAHDRKFADIQSTHSDWLRRRAATQDAVRQIDEIAEWQRETLDMLRVFEQQSQTITDPALRERWSSQTLETVQTWPIAQQTAKLEEAFTTVSNGNQNRETIQRLTDVKDQQTQLNNRIHQLVENATRAPNDYESIVPQPAAAAPTQPYVSAQPQVEPHAPVLITPLQSLRIEEGEKAEFIVQFDAEPEAECLWFKDGRDVHANADYAQSYENGWAKLVIEQTILEDTGMFTVVARNELGITQSAAKLTVKTRSQLDEHSSTAAFSPIPHFVAPLPNLTTEAGLPFELEAVTTPADASEVVWFRENEILRESERIVIRHDAADGKLRHELRVEDAGVEDSGVYKLSVRNAHGAAESKCTVVVNPIHQRAAPPPPVQPQQPQSYAQPPLPSQPNVPPAPRIDPPLTNTVVRVGDSAIMECRVLGVANVEWTRNDAPLRSDGNIHIQPPDSNGWTRVQIRAASVDSSGLFLCVAQNEGGVARSGATLSVLPAQPEAPQRSEDNQYEIRHQIRREADIREKFQSVSPQRTIPIQRVDTAFYSDGGAPSPQSARSSSITRFPAVEECTDFGFSSLANAPHFIHPLQPEYTVNEGEKCKLDCLMVGNPRPKCQWFFNDRPIQSNWQFAEFTNIGDTYSIEFSPAKLSNSGHYRMVAENIRGRTESATVVHVRPRSMIPPPQSATQRRIQPRMVAADFGGTDYGQQRRAQSTFYDQRSTPPPPKRTANEGAGMSASMYSPYQQRSQTFTGASSLSRSSTTPQPSGQPPHFLQTLSSRVAQSGESARFDAVVSGIPAPAFEWSKDGVPINAQTHPQIRFDATQAGRASIEFAAAQPPDSGKYMCTARNSSGVATSSAQFVVRPNTVAPDFVERLISEEVAEGEQLRWSIRVTGDPAPTVTWLRNGQPIPNCDEVQLVEEGNGLHTMIIGRVEPVDGGQFTCVAENIAGEARSTADLVVRSRTAAPGTYFHVTKITQEKSVRGEEVARNATFSIESPRAAAAAGNPTPGHGQHGAVLPAPVEAHQYGEGPQTRVQFGTQYQTTFPATAGASPTREIPIQIQRQ